ncbi:hypothetical protein ILUMI_12069 [Ignelater luminosus]|uniref:PiggyBac transposable element-derived protein domain-containing protein n=1 Tax=Ignelater luminosus TaxID=2038154 RepID=A0A8K0GC54_IGNLU|nr:hypothetical protein ILUMI_12069 [Ignelater luminosus]
MRDQHNIEELAYALQMSFGNSGNVDAAKVMEIAEGSSSTATRGIGSSPRLLTKLNEAYPQRQYKFLVDNLFTELPLLRIITDYRCGFTGTVGQNRIENCPLNKNSMKKAARGFITGVRPIKAARKYCAAKKNSHMGGTDLTDSNIANYRIKLRNNKWYWQIYNFGFPFECLDSLQRCEEAAKTKPVYISIRNIIPTGLSEIHSRQ